MWLRLSIQCSKLYFENKKGNLSAFKHHIKMLKSLLNIKDTPSYQMLIILHFNSTDIQNLKGNTLNKTIPIILGCVKKKKQH